MSKIPNLVFRNPNLDRGDSEDAVVIECVGTAPLIMNRFPDKVVHQMLKKHMGGDSKREAKVPRDVIEQAIQRNITGAVAIPSTAVKKGMLTAASGLKSLARAKTQLRIGVFVHGASIPITYDAMTPRMDITRLAGMARTPDIRFRPMFTGWKMRFAIVYDEQTISAGTIADLVSRAGRVGVGEWRPEKNGDFGTYKISRIVGDSDERREVMAICEPIIKPVEIPDWALDQAVDLEMINQMLRSQDAAVPESEPSVTEDEEDAAEEAPIKVRSRRRA